MLRPTEPELIARARVHGDAVALLSGDSTYTYSDLLNRSSEIAYWLLRDSDDLKEASIACLIPAGFDYVATQWAVWRSGGVAVPLCVSAAEPEWRYILLDSQAAIVVTTREEFDKLEHLCLELNLAIIIVEELLNEETQQFPDVRAFRRAMMLYTSGTTGSPKGVVTTHGNIQAQIELLVEAWEWSKADRIPLFLPLHHIHGIINVTCCALWCGATIETYAGFDLKTILRRVAEQAYSVFMAVPTIYVKLIRALDDLTVSERDNVVCGFSGMRLMVSGSAALPASVHQQWYQLTGQPLLERYGMTEIGMALSNPFHGERRPGSVGQPLPGVELRLKTECGEIVSGEGAQGEIQVRGPAVFSEYWNRPQVTRDSFDEGWFRTGDMAVLESGYYRILGRLSVDIIKSGGYKLSALEIEAVLLQHPAIRECSVVGVADDVWGEAVAVAVVPSEPTGLELDDLRLWCRDRMAAYKIPKRLLVLDSLPKNAMGKVTKPGLTERFTL